MEAWWRIPGSCGMDADGRVRRFGLAGVWRGMWVGGEKDEGSERWRGGNEVDGRE